MIDDESEPEADEGGRATVIGVAFDWGEDWEPSHAEDLEPDVLRFDVGGLSFAAPAVCVAEVAPSVGVTPIPGVPHHIAGVAVRRRHVLTILNLMELFGLRPGAAPGDETRLVVFEADELEAGVLVDRTGLGVWPVSADSPNIDDLPAGLRQFVRAARWLPGGRVLLLDIGELLRATAVR